MRIPLSVPGWFLVHGNNETLLDAYGETFRVSDWFKHVNAGFIEMLGYALEEACSGDARPRTLRSLVHLFNALPEDTDVFAIGSGFDRLYSAEEGLVREHLVSFGRMQNTPIPLGTSAIHLSLYDESNMRVEFRGNVVAARSLLSSARVTAARFCSRPLNPVVSATIHKVFGCRYPTFLHCTIENRPEEMSIHEAIKHPFTSFGDWPELAAHYAQCLGINTRGSEVVYKVARRADDDSTVLIALRIPEGAKRNIGVAAGLANGKGFSTTLDRRKNRAEKATVVGMYNAIFAANALANGEELSSVLELDDDVVVHSLHDPGFIYKNGMEVIPDEYDDSTEVCAGGVHYFVRVWDALAYLGITR